MTNKVIEIEQKIIELKVKLSKTDYKAFKYLEGCLTLAEYIETKNQRNAWREEINALEQQLKVLRGN